MNIKRFIKLYTIVVIACLCLFAVGCKHDEVTPEQEKGSFTDPVNGDVYSTVKIGNQWWMAENLKAKKYRNGNPINLIQSDTSLWRKDTVGAYCIYDNRSNAPGLLYNWYAITNPDNIAPAGWHIPSDNEWKSLEQALGMSAGEANNINWRGDHEANKLKAAGIIGFSKYNEDTWPTNESGFSAIGGSCRLFNGAWGDPGLFALGFWWTSSSGETTGKAWYRYLDYKSTNVFRNYVPKSYGFSIRCVKD